MPNNQTLKEERERRLGLVATWVAQFPREGKSERDLDRHIQREFGVNRFTSHSYRQTARERLCAAGPALEGLAGVLLEWAEQTYDEIEKARAPLMEKAKRRIALIGTLARLCPKHVVNYQPPVVPLFDPEEQRRFLAGEGEYARDGAVDGED